MRVTIASTYPPQRCGIASYTQALARSLAAAGSESVTVLAEHGGGQGVSEGVTSTPVFHRRGDFVDALDAAVTPGQGQVFHLQHAPDIFGMDDRVPRLLAALRKRGIITVVTLHTVHSWWSGLHDRRRGVGRFHRALAGSADAIVVHDSNGLRTLVDHGVPRDRVHVIAHGAARMVSPGVEESRRRLGLPIEGKLLLHFGFIHIQKNLHTAVLAMRRLRHRVSNCRLLIAGSIQNRAWYNRAYLWLVRRLIRLFDLEGLVSVQEGFVPEDRVPVLYGATDLVLLPYAQSYSSASGIAHGALAAGRVPVCSRSPKFSDLADELGPDVFVPRQTGKAWARVLAGLLLDDSRRDQLMARARSAAERRSWPTVAEGHLALYRALV